MNSYSRTPGPPHFPIKGPEERAVETDVPVPLPEGPGALGVANDVGILVMRGAECLMAALLECTAHAGLNEARFRVLDSLKRRTQGECSQADLAIQLLQSESNLSTLLDRMSSDGLISRTRSQTDRRRSLIRLTPSGLEALAQAHRARSAAIERLLRYFAPEEADRLAEGLRQLVGDLEGSLGLRSHRETLLDRRIAVRAGNSPPAATAPVSGGSRDLHP